jgi:hypothetical protein
MEFFFYSDRLETGCPAFDFLRSQEICPYSTACRPALGPTQPPVQWVKGVLFLGVKADEP